MNWKEAFARAVRTFAQSLAAALLAFGPVADFADVKLQGSKIVLALYTATLAAIISFLQNVAEEQAGVNILPK